MLAFIQSRRRQIGIVTLATAMLFAGGWMWSLKVGDAKLITNDFLLLATSEHYLLLCAPDEFSAHTITQIIDGEPVERTLMSASRTVIVEVPYWLIAPALMLCSAYLLFGKPRQSPRKAVAVTIDSRTRRVA